MEFRIFGPLEVHDNGRQIELGGPKQRALLGVLLLHANESISSDFGSTGWPEPEGRWSDRTSARSFAST